MKKKIMWHLPYGIIGGVETLYAVILKHIDRDRYEHIITCPSLIQSWCARKYRGFARVYSFKDMGELETLLRVINPDLIMGTHGNTLYEAMALLDNPPPIIEIVHGSHVWAEHNIHMPKTWTKHIICVSNSAERVYKMYSDSDIATSVIINGVDTELFFPRRELRIKASIVGYMGRFLEGDKHITQIIKAFKSLGDLQSRLYLIGGTGQEIIRLRHFSKRQKVERRVKLTSHTEKPEEQHVNFDIATVRSEAEGYCNFAAEALASGIPLVCYNFGGLLEHVPRGAVAIAKNQQEYATLLKHVYNNYDVRIKMRKLGLQFIKNEGSAIVMIRSYERLFTRFFSGKSSNRAPPKRSKSRSEILPKKTVVSALGQSETNVTRGKPIVGICNPDWHGIAEATRNCTDIVVPFNPNISKVIMEIVSHKPRAILISGMGQGFDSLANLFQKHHTSIPIYAYYHGGASHYSFSSGLFGNSEEYEAFQKLIVLYKRGVVSGIAVSSPGFDTYLKSCGIDATFCGNIMEDLTVPNHIKPLPGVNIGNWNRHRDHKHTSIGFAAVQMIDNAIIHCLDNYPPIPGMDISKVKSYPEMPKHIMLQRYKEMTVNLQLSFIETFNISVLEMWFCGRPVVLGPGNFTLIDTASELKELVYVEDHTNPLAVAEAIQRSLRNADKIISLQNKQLDKLNRASKARWRVFYAN